MLSECYEAFLAEGFDAKAFSAQVIQQAGICEQLAGLEQAIRQLDKELHFQVLKLLITAPAFTTTELNGPVS